MSRLGGYPRRGGHRSRPASPTSLSYSANSSACVVHIPTGQILGRGHNQRVQLGSRVLHAETDALENATLTGEPGGPPVPDNMLPECAMFTTMSPCPMCSGACILYGIKLVVLAENETSASGEPILADHGVEVVNLKDQGILGMFREWVKQDGGKIWGNPQLATPQQRPGAVEQRGGWVPS